MEGKVSRQTMKSASLFRSAVPSFRVEHGGAILPRWQMIAQHFESVECSLRVSVIRYARNQQQLRRLQSAGRKVRTPNGSMPRKNRGRGFRKGAATESVTEK